MPRRVAQFYPQRVNLRVPNMAYTADITNNDVIHVQLGAPATLDSDGILAAQSINAAVTVTTFASTYAPTAAIMGPFGRGLRVVASGAATSTVIVNGRDYLGQRMSETLTLNGATAVLGIKAFRYIDSVVCAATASTTIDLGWRDLFGLPYKFEQIAQETKNGVVAANAGTFVAGLATATAATATNADVRGTYLPVTVIPDGTNTFELRYIADTSNLHGNRQFTA